MSSLDLNSDLDPGSTFDQVESKPSSPKTNEEYNTINNSEPLENSFTDLPFSNLPSVEAVFSNEKIRNKIWSYAEPNEFFKFRLVSRAWRRCATNDALLKWKKNKVIAMVTFDDKPDKPKTLQNLFELMDITGTNPFPCSNFIIHSSNKKPDFSELQEFLNKHGARVTKLSLKFNYYKSCKEEDYNGSICSCGQSWLECLIIKLLTEQAPNLKKLKIYWTLLENKIPETTCETQQQQQPSEDCIPENVSLILHSNLLSVSFGEKNIEASLFERICALAPKLEQFTTTNLKLFQGPNNRLYLLKKLVYDPDPWNGEEGLAKFRQITNSEGELKLKELKLKVRHINEKFDRFKEMWPEVADVCNKLFEKSRSSLKKLWVEPMGFLPGLKIPQMHLVEHLHLQNYDGDDPYVSFFPSGTRISEVFPNLHTIQLPDNFRPQGRRTEIVLLNGVLETVPSVKVIIQSCHPIDTEAMKPFFPNAEITY